MKDVRFQQQHLVEENMSNLTSASGEASASSGNKTEVGTISTSNSQQYLANSSQTQAQTQPLKRKRNLPGNPDPDAEVIALSPKSLLATNRFVCEICNKGFQRDQNLQLHKRGHNLPWKLKQRASKEIRKKVYVCPEPSCVHHDPSRALGDLTGIKKHFCRKHGEKKWKCEKCSKRYAVQSDWKAHSKTCGTREYRCDCGTLFSRRDSFITHRAFCDALAEESATAVSNTNPLVASSQPSSHMNIHQVLQQPLHQFNPQELQAFSNLKKEPQSFNLLRPEMPPWLAAFPTAHAGGPSDSTADMSTSSSSIFTRLDHHHDHQQHQAQHLYHHDQSSNSNSDVVAMSNPNPSSVPTLSTYRLAAAAATPSPHLSATALLQKAAQMGATMSKTSSSSPAGVIVGPHAEAHVSSTVEMGHDDTTGSGSGFGLKLSSRDQDQMMVLSRLAPFGNKASSAIAGDTSIANSSAAAASASSFLQGMMGNHTFEESHSYEDAFCGILNSNKDGTAVDVSSLTKASYLSSSSTSGTAKNGGHGNDSLTRDFLGLKPLGDIFSIAGLGNCMADSHVDQQSSEFHKQWQG